MKYIQFIDTCKKEFIDASLLSAWSVKENGGLPTDTEFILYTTDKVNFNNPDIYKVYDTVVEPPKGTSILNTVDWDNVPMPIQKSNYQRQYRTGKVCWLKFLCFLETPCDGEPVIYTDYDILCTSSIYKTLPYGNYTWSGVPWGKKHCNGGFIIKTEGFDKSDAKRRMLEPLLNPEYYQESFNICSFNDERGMSWYLNKYNTKDFLALPRTYNEGTIYAVRRNIPLSSLNMIHYISTTKPWLNPNKCYQEFTDKWNTEMTKMKSELCID